MRHGPSLVVVIPKEWADGMQIAKGDHVELLYDGELRVRKIPEATPPLEVVSP